MSKNVIPEPDGLTSMRVRLHAYVIGNLKREAKVRGVTVSEIVEEACQLWLERSLVQQPPPAQSVTAWRCATCGQLVPIIAAHNCGRTATTRLDGSWSCPACGTWTNGGHACYQAATVSQGLS